MKLQIEHRGSAIAGMAKYDVKFIAETVEEVRRMSVLYELQPEGICLTLDPDHTGVTISVGKHKDTAP